MGQSTEELRRDIARTRGELGETLDAIGDRVSPGRMIERRKNRASNMIRSARDRVMGSASDTSQALADAGHAIGDTASGTVDTLKSSPEVVRNQTQGNPLMAGAIAFGVGLLTASVFKPSEVEKQVAGQLMDKAEPLTQEFKQMGQETLEHLKEPALAAVEQVKETATDAAQAVAETTKHSAETSKLTALDAADTVRSDINDD
ncbi:MAG TPA: DUF3618 domain-containing protein [Ilumatobacteraceae bacterium]|nr:DUF3618 domain-containing protein [Ilumatobacteraceae bacterium]